MTIGAQMKATRKALGKTQKQMATILGISPTTYYRYERDRDTPSFEKIKMFANKFRVTIHIYPDGFNQK